jgi:ATP-dependent Lhr-like helicase
LLDRELPCLQWPHLFRALRRMELSGEVFAGQFFEGVPGVQFASASAVHALRQGFGHDSIFWLNAQDPASCAGLDLPGLKADLPRRVAGNHLVYRGADLVVVSQRSGKSLTIHLQPDDPLLKRCFGFMDNLLARRIEPVASIGVEEINGAPALKSPYLPVLRDLFDVAADAKRVNVWRRGG